MRKDKQQAINLRQKGKSYQQIYKELGISKSTLSNWFCGQDWSKDTAVKLAKEAKEKNKIRLKHLNNVRGENLKRVYEKAEEEAREDCQTLKYHPLFIAGIMLYWGEGDKVSKNGFRISNSDPLIIRVFVKFLRNVCSIKPEKIKASLLLYPDHDKEKSMSFWKENAALEDIPFTKTHVILGRSGNGRKSNGVCIINVSSSYLKKKMLVWMRDLPEIMLDDDYFRRA